jgi:hypothetical protein
MAAAAHKLRYALVEISHPLLPNIFEQPNVVYISHPLLPNIFEQSNLVYITSIVAKHL